jgi:hypothetical protein
MMTRSAWIACLFLPAFSFGQISENEPFVATVRKTMRQFLPSGKEVVSAQVVRYLRDGAGNLREEARRVENGVEDPSPFSIQLTMYQDGSVYWLHPQSNMAERLTDHRNDLAKLYRESSSPDRGPRREIAGIPCYSHDSTFRGREGPLGRGSVCKVVGAGIMIWEQARFSGPGGSGIWEWSTELVAFERNTQPDPALMKVPESYAVQDVTRQTCRSCRSRAPMLAQQ